MSFTDEVHDKKGVPVLVGSAVRDADYVRVADYCGELCFGKELLRESGAVRGICDIEDLDSVFGSPHAVDSPEDRPHSAASDLAYDVIFSDLPHWNYYSKICHSIGCRSYVFMDRAARRRARGDTHCVFRVPYGIMRTWESAGRNPRNLKSLLHVGKLALEKRLEEEADGRSSGASSCLLSNRPVLGPPTKEQNDALFL